MTVLDAIEGRARWSAEQADALAWLAALPSTILGDNRRAAILIVTGPVIDLERLRLLAPPLCVLAEVADGEHVWVTHPDWEWHLRACARALRLWVEPVVKRRVG